MGGLFAKLLTVEIVQIVVVAIARSSGIFLKHLCRLQGFPALGRLFGAVGPACWVRGFARVGRGLLLGEIAADGPLHFLKQFLHLVSKLNL
jgi:hypothetical protein